MSRAPSSFIRAKRKFALMNELGARDVLVCSNVSPLSLGGIDRAAADLRELGAVAEAFDVRIGFEALAFGRHVWDYRDAWEIVRRADHPRIGLILDSWHVLARKLPVDPIRSIPADRITFVQVADAPAMDMDLLQWSRHFRNFPGQGDMDVDGFMRALLATGYDGWISHEIFNDRFRMASPRRIAEDGERSLIWLRDRLEPGTLPPRVEPEAVEWIEFAISEEDAPALEAVFTGLGFRPTGRHRSKEVTRWSQGAINLVINTEPDGLAHSHQIVHGPSVVAIGLRVGDAAAAIARAEGLRMHVYRGEIGPGELDIPAVRGIGGSLLYFTDSKGDLARVWEIEFEPVEPAPPGPLSRIDHFAQSMTPDEMLTWRLFYLSLLDLDRTPQVDVIDPAGVVESMALHTPDRTLRVCLNASASERTQSSRFLDEFFGAGTQHIAFLTDDIFAAAEAMQAAGLETLPIPDNYYDDLEARLGLEPEFVDRLRESGILYDEDEGGRFFQIYTRAFKERFFFEIVEREGYTGYGAPNAPIRLAAQARLARQPAIPRM
ncbi:MAG TPA: TIM barrel protein [Amaricoccus sp.]|nr:TIM barrel protein [Amaricoccus sp.]